MLFSVLFRRHFQAPGGIEMLMRLALPIIISEASETVMMFVDRLFLASLTRHHLAAAMSGGLTSFMFMTLFFGILGYVNAMVAQYFGSGQRRRCAVVVSQALLLAFLFYPLVLAARPLGLLLFRLFRHDPVQLDLEMRYFGILLYGSIFGLVRVSLASFFSGIGRTRIVMVANLLAMVVNIVGNYVLIFGHWGFPELGIEGAALGTILGSATCTGVLLVTYFMPRLRAEFGTLSGLRVDLAIMRRFLHFGWPAGVEFLVNMVAFNLVVQVLHSYGADVASAVTIVFSWDMVSFIPMIGLNIGVMSLVGRYMGAGLSATAAKSAYSGLAFVIVYAGVLGLLFVFMPLPLVALFARGEGDYEAVIELAVPMLRLVAAYVFFDGVYLVFGGALRGAGDTRWAMWASMALHWLLATTGLVMVLWLKAPPLLTWAVFVFEVTLLGSVFYLRFRRGKWRTIEVIERPAGVPSGVPYTDVPTVDGLELE